VASSADGETKYAIRTKPSASAPVWYRPVFVSPLKIMDGAAAEPADASITPVGDIDGTEIDRILDPSSSIVMLLLPVDANHLNTSPTPSDLMMGSCSMVVPLALIKPPTEVRAKPIV